jgi:hypothetical protein
MIIDKFTIQTQDSIAIARDKVTRQIDNNPPLFKMYITGQVSENNFNLCRISSGGTIPLATMNGLFETVQSFTVVHLKLEVKSSLIIVSSLFALLFSICISQITINNPGKDLLPFTGMMIVFFVIFIYSFQKEKIFYRKKLPQIFL